MHSCHNIDNVFQLIDGHIQFLQRNTGLTIDPTVQHYILNLQNVLANNRHFINWTAQKHSQTEMQPQRVNLY